MAETCIVCLGDLEASGADPLQNPSESDVPPGLYSNHGAKNIGGQQKHDPQSSSDEEQEWIAHLLPCGHNLHNECLKPWVERANSCPICRASFNMVELSKNVGGDVISSYSVQDKQQVADIDPSMILEDEEDLLESLVDPCMICEEYGDQEQLHICDGCDGSCHVFCAGLDSIPSGLWFCPNCMENPRIMAQARQRSAQSRQRPRRHVTNSSAREWARVWRSVWHRLHFDLEFPDDEVLDRRRSSAQRREFSEWERRFQVAQRQGAGSRFRQTVALLEPHVQRDKPAEPDPESQEELRAWNAFEKARDAQDEPSPSNRRKRKATASPSDEQPAEQPERKLKRPRTRRTVDIAESSADGAAASATTIAASTTAAQPSSSRRPSEPDIPRLHPNKPETEEVGPSFLQSLLKEVETSKVPEDGQVPRLELIPIIERASSPRPSSPGNSPTSSNHPTPGGMTPPPLSLSRPASPPPLTSNVGPVYGPAPTFPPFSPADDDSAERKARAVQRRKAHLSPLSSPPRSKDASPTRPNMSYSTKSEIQKMVKAALRPLYLKQEVTKDEYTDINRDVSRRMYDKVGDASGLADQETRERWQKIASTEVENAVKARKSDEVDVTDP